MKSIQEKQFLYLLLISLFILLLDIILKRIYLRKNLAIINPHLIYGIKIENFNLNILIFLLFFFFLVLSIIGFIRDNEFKLFIFPTIVSFSNVIDRVQFNGVIDYIRIPLFPFNILFGYFNLCDAFIVLFIILFLILEFKEKKDQ